MRLRRLARLPLPHRLATAALAADGVQALIAGRRRTAVRLFAVAALASRSTAAGLAVELGWRIVRRIRRTDGRSSSHRPRG